ncbi:D-hexose-6-phosphate mutarotase [Luteimonas deserti]|nr:D-hexose-6-phosphate mutarotase [Luteimonas deserti]
MTRSPLRSGTVFDLPADYGQRMAESARTPVVPSDVSLPGVRLGEYAGYAAVLVETPAATAAVALHGGHLLSYVPVGQTDVLWLSPGAKPPPHAIRGGVPVIWPYFGRQGQPETLPSHGFVRTLRWHVVSATREDDGAIRLVLAPPPLAGLELDLTMELRVGDTLEQTLVTRNRGTHEIAFSQAMHTYFRVSDVSRVQVQGLEGLRYLDKNDGYAAHVQRGDWVLDEPRDPGRSDRIYTDAPGRYRLRDPDADRMIDLQVDGGRTLVVWNPGEAGAARMDDVGGAWRGFLCLEAANAGAELVELAPGATHRLTQTIRSLPLP